MKNRTYLTKAHIGTIVKGTLLAGVLVTSTLMAGCKDNDTETTDAEVVAEVDASAEKGSAVAEKNGKASGTTATAGNSSTEVENAEADNAGTTTEADSRQAASTESTSKATGTTASSRGNNSTTETSRANTTTESPKTNNSTTETSKPNSTTEVPKPSNSTTETSRPNNTTEAPAHTHTWVENTEAVYVPEVGHYEEVMVDAGGEVPHYVEHTLCAHCDYDYTADGLQPGAGVHICPDGTTGSNYGGRMVQDGYIIIPPYYEKQWVVDTPAHTEQQGNGTYKCSTCGAEK